MDNLEKLKSEAEISLTENEVDRIAINKILEVIEEAYTTGLQDGIATNWEEHDN